MNAKHIILATSLLLAPAIASSIQAISNCQNTCCTCNPCTCNPCNCCNCEGHCNNNKYGCS